MKVTEVDERPEEINGLGGLGGQIEELAMAIMLPMQQVDWFRTFGIKLPDGCLMY